LEVLFSNHGCRVQDLLSGQIVGTGCKVGRLYEAISMKIPIQTHMHCATAQSQDVWHSRLGHSSSNRLQYLISRGDLGQVQQIKLTVFLVNLQNIMLCHLTVVTLLQMHHLI